MKWKRSKKAQQEAKAASKDETEKRSVSLPPTNNSQPASLPITNTNNDSNSTTNNAGSNHNSSNTNNNNNTNNKNSSNFSNNSNATSIQTHLSMLNNNTSSININNHVKSNLDPALKHNEAIDASKFHQIAHLAHLSRNRLQTDGIRETLYRPYT